MKKRKAILIGVGVLLLVVAVLLVGPLRPARDRVAVIPLSGTISSQRGSLVTGQTITPGLVRQHLGRAERDRAVRAIVLRIETPGGTVPASQEILREIARVSEIKPIVVSMENMAASGGYYISTGADRIVALPTTLTGSIGVISQIANVEELYESLGIEIHTFKGGRHKDMYRGLRALTPEEERIMQGLVDEYYEHFIEVVARGRGLSEEEARELATGQLYTGAEAHRLDLVDELGGLDTAITTAKELAGLEVARVEFYRPPRASLLSLFRFADAIEMRLLGLSAHDIILLETLSQSYPEPVFLHVG